MGECASQPARSRRCKSAAMKNLRPTWDREPCSDILEDVGEASARKQIALDLARSR